MPRLRLALSRSFALIGIASVLSACGGSGAASPGGATTPTVQRERRTISFDPAPLYRQMGMIARGQPFPMVGRMAFVPSAHPDTTHVVVVLGFAPASLRFARETDSRYRANYSISLTTEREGRPAQTLETTEAVVVGAFRETERTDESILFQEILDLEPGTYRLSLSVRDVSSQRGIVEQVDLVVPSFATRALSSPVPVNKVIPRTSRDSLPYLLARPRAAASLGTDSVLPMYVESVSPSDSVLVMLARGETGRDLWNESVRLESHGNIAAGVVQIPVQRLAIGVSQLLFVGSGGTDTSSVYVFVGFGDDLPIARYEDMLQFLRYFARPARLQALRDAPEESRPAAWAAFMRDTDSTPETPAHEELRAYFARLMRANARFREDGSAGWLSDRGRVLLALGEPDQIIEPAYTDIRSVRQQFWEYRSLNMQLAFYDQTGAGRWNLTPASESRFEVEIRRHLR
jgi:GWxTD domain-containing protein